MGMGKGFKLIGKNFETHELAKNAAVLYFPEVEVYIRYHSEKTENKWIIYTFVHTKKASKKVANWIELPTIRNATWGKIAKNFVTAKVEL